MMNVTNMHGERINMYYVCLFWRFLVTKRGQLIHFLCFFPLELTTLFSSMLLAVTIWQKSSGNVRVKAKVHPVQTLRLCTGRTAHRGSRGIALTSHDRGTRRGLGFSFTPRPLFTPGKDPVPIVQEAGWVPAPVWTCVENLAPTGIRSPDRPAVAQSLYRLSYPVHENVWVLKWNGSLIGSWAEVYSYSDSVLTWNLKIYFL